MHVPEFGLNTERYGIYLHIQCKCGKIRTRKTPNMDTFHAVYPGDWRSEHFDEGQKHEKCCGSYNLKSLIKVPICYNNLDSLSCIDLIVTNKPSNFQNLCATKMSLPDFHKMKVTALRMQFYKLKPRVLLYRDFINFQIKLFKILLKVN